MSTRFVAGTNTLGFWIVQDTHNGRELVFGAGESGRIGALDHADFQNRAQDQAERHAFGGYADAAEQEAAEASQDR